MEFKSLKNIETSFKHIRLYVMVFAGLCLLISAIAIFASFSFAREQREKIYVLDNGKSLILALAQDAAANRPVEAREHVRRFHELFFTLAPDKDAIESNMKRAFMLTDKTSYDYYKDLAEKGYYNRIISGNIHQRIEIDSISCNFDSHPYKVVTFAKQYIVRSSNTTIRSLVTECNLVNSVRSDNNPQGFTIEETIKERCEALSPKQRKRVLIIMCLLYFLASLWMIMGFFIKDRQNEQQDFMEMFDGSISEDTLDMPELMNNNN